MPGPLKSFARLFGRLAVALAVFALALVGTPSRAQEPSGPAPFSQQTLDELLAPIALYPDALLTQVLIASTYPLEVVQAARLVERSRDMPPDALAAVAEAQPWDASVIALVRFPSVLAMMDEKLDWTQQLGDAFLANQAALMDTVQALRAKAYAAGNLGSNAQQNVVVQERVIVIEPAQPQIVYVPFFDPISVYGRWWWATPPRWVWAPPPRYWPPGWRPGWGPGIGWGRPIGAPPWIWHGRAPNWQQRNIVVNNTTVINNNTVVVNDRRAPPVWTHNPGPRRGVSNPDRRDRPPPGAAGPSNPGFVDRGRPAGPQPARPGQGANAPQTRPQPMPGDGGTRPAARPGNRPPAAGDAAAPPRGRAPGEASNRPERGTSGRPGAEGATPRPAPETAGQPRARPAPQAPAADSPPRADTRPPPPERNRGDRDTGGGRAGAATAPRATP